MAAVFLMAALIIDRSIFSSLFYWSYITIGTLLFFTINYILTSLPVVIYRPSAILGNRFFTIPFEDFLYNFILLSSYYIIYIAAKKILKRLD